MRLRYPTVMFTAPVFVGLALGGCGDGGEPRAASTGTAALHAAAAPHAHPIMRRLFEVIGDSNLSAGQQADFERVAADVEPRYVATNAARAALIEAVAAQVEQGKIDAAALQPSIDAFSKSVANERSANHAALTRFGVILARPQRGALMSAFQSIAQARPEDGAGETAKPTTPGLLRGLDLSADQRSQLRLAKATFAEGAGQERFAGLAHDPLARTIRFLDRVLPILTAEQRATVAQRVRAKTAGAATNQSSWEL
jgi:hypothetical protein